MAPHVRGHELSWFQQQLTQEQFETLHLSHARPPVNPDVRAYFEKAEFLDPTEGDWVNKPELPSTEEVMGTDTDEDVWLAPNRTYGPWPSKHEYLKTHYNLVREDGVAPLRDAVAMVRDNLKMNDNKVVYIYEKVFIVGVTFAHRGLAFRTRFSTRRAGKKIVWQYSKRLISGSVVALSPANDRFSSKCVVAVVAARTLENVSMDPPEIDIFFARPEDIEFDPQQEWIMVEGQSGYYEAYRHTMKALQKLSTERFPLSEHICLLDPHVGVPQHITDDPYVDVPSLGVTTTQERINVLEQWPKLPRGKLDQSQWEALNEMLTKRLAIVQGPPGTGKTYISVIALRILLSRMAVGDPPIIIAAQTNHALDQLINHVTRFESNYIRLGGRSTDVEIRRRTLFSIRTAEPPRQLEGGLLAPTKKDYRLLVSQMVELLKPFHGHDCNRPLSADLLRKSGLLTQAQCDSLQACAENWIRHDTDANIEPLVSWLGDQVKAFKVDYSGENFGFLEDEIDLEYEQLKEIEAEQGQEEDDFETLKGQFIPLREAFCGQNLRSISEDTMEKYLRKKDLLEIPVKFRGAIYQMLRNNFIAMLNKMLRKLAIAYSNICNKLQIGKWEVDHCILRQAKIIGMTTTGLSKYRGLISSLNPKVVLIEEAAEVIEAPISVACFNSLEQLILVGDHQQLKGHCTVHDLASEPFFLEVSMFERLVKNGMPFKMLREQRRMIPEIRELLTPIYGVLHDHPSVHNRDPVPGMGDLRSFFFTHDWPEINDSLASKLNEPEAVMVVEFFAYLVMNGIPARDITVLTFYNGQRKMILKLMKTHPHLSSHWVKVVTVDSYQGEENEIVLLSLVRSSQHHGIGFLDVDSRVCVALSRAKRGFYIFGNAQKVIACSELWKRVVALLYKDLSRLRLDCKLPLTCVKHGRQTIIKDPEDWQTINGGCDRPCLETMECGHACPILCHGFSHNWVNCKQHCGHVRPCCGIVCQKKCANKHEHSCDCVDKSLSKLLQPASSNHQAKNDDQAKKLMTQERRAVATRNEWMAFAQGGAREMDAALAVLSNAEDPSSEEVQKAMKLVDERFIPKALKAKMALVDVETGEGDTRASKDVVQGHLLD